MRWREGSGQSSLTRWTEGGPGAWDAFATIALVQSPSLA